VIPDWALTTIYWLHMLATVIWIGGLVTLSIFVLPPASHALKPADYAALLERTQKRLDPAAWFSLALLLATGMIQMSSSEYYQGFLVIGNRWAVALLIKHIVFLGMVLISAYMTWWLLPALRRNTLQQIQAAPDELQGSENETLHKREIALIRLNLALGVIILALTAVARTSGG